MAISKANIGQALHSVADDHVTAVANDIYDETLQKYQSEINAEVGQGDGVYDISEANPTNGNPTPYGDLQAALTAFTDTTKKKGGMTIKFIQGTGANAKYVQYRYIGTSIDDDDFLNEDNWSLGEIETEDTSDADLEFSDNNDNALVRFAEGGIETKNFDSNKTQQNVGEREYDEFSTTKSYGIGDIVLRNKLLYKFITIHSAGNWNDGEVEQTNIPEVISDKIPNIEIDDTDEADFEVSDKRGNKALLVGGGHIRTGNFDSRDATFKVEDSRLVIGEDVEREEYERPIRNKNVLAGKVVAFLGDSITYGTGATSNSNRYSTFFCNLANCIERNLGIAGTCFANNTTNGLASDRFITRATAANLSSAHLIFVFGGTNDFSYDSKAIGDYFVEETITPPSGSDNRIGTKKKTPNSDNETFAGALHELILQIRSISNAQIVFVTPLNRGRYNAKRPISSEANVNGDYLQDFIHCIDAICEFYAIPVIHLGQLFGFDWQFDDSSNKNYYDNDGIHPNNYGHERIAKLLYSWCLNNLIM